MELAKSLNKTVSFYVKFENNRLIKKYSPKQLGVWSKNELAKMGPSFIKIGQFVSTRSDVFSKEFTNELKDLQDNVAPVPWLSLKQSVDPKITSVTETPLASASIGQVHLGKLNEQDIIIKIKRPNIDHQIKNDFEGLLVFIKFLKTFSDDRRLTEFEILFTEYYNLLQEEIDFKKEASNMQLFKDLFKNTKWIKVPKVYKQVSNENSIVMEYVPAIKINDVKAISNLKFDTEKIARKLVECYVDQIIKYGYVHIDPHPGNLGITPQGKIVFYDYGMVLNLDDKIQEHFDELLVALYDKDIDAIANLAVEIGLVVVEPQNIAYFKKFLLFFLNYIEKMNVNDFKISYFDNLSKTDMPFLISSKFLLLLRGISILEGNCKALDPTFNYKKTLDPYIQDYLIDVKYIENKAMVDISTLQSFPSKIKEQEIEFEIMRMNNKTNRVSTKEKRNNKAMILGTVLVFMSVFNDVPVSIYMAILSTILLL